MNIRRTAMAAAVWGAVLAGSARAQGPWYVATNGSDAVGVTGLSWADAFQTISNAVTNATAGTIYVSNGVYTLSQQISFSKALVIEGVGGYSNVVVDGNRAGRCFVVDHTSAVLRGLTITNGYVASAEGGGVYLSRGTIRDCRIVGNYASNSFGGGISVYNLTAGITNFILNCRIEANTAVMGGGVSVRDAYWGDRVSAVIEDSDFIGNLATIATNGGSGEPGGGAFYFQAKHATLRRCRLINNTSDGNGNTGKSARGGGIGTHGIHGTALFEFCEIVGNVVSNSPNVCGGGGIHASGREHTIRNCLIASNWSRTWGGGILLDATNVTNWVVSSTIAGNTSSTLDGNGVYLLGNGFDEFRNCVVYTNRTAVNWFFGNTARTNNVYFTCTPTAMGGIGNITAAPRFTNEAGRPFRLAADSPCINAGSNQAWMAGASDLDGRPRVDRFSRVVDMGAFEYRPAGTLVGGR